MQFFSDGDQRLRDPEQLTLTVKAPKKRERTKRELEENDEQVCNDKSLLTSIFLVLKHE